MSLPKVMIVGGGPGGILAAQALVGEVTLVERRDYHEVPWPNVHVPVDRTVTDKSTLPIQEIPKLGKVLHNYVTRMTDQAVQLDDGSWFLLSICWRRDPPGQIQSALALTPRSASASKPKRGPLKR